MNIILWYNNRIYDDLTKFGWLMFWKAKLRSEGPEQTEGMGQLHEIWQQELSPAVLEWSHPIDQCKLGTLASSHFIDLEAVAGSRFAGDQ